jgi:hypothetical protein
MHARDSQPVSRTASTLPDMASALSAARCLLAGTVEAVSPALRRAELLACLTDYRRTLAALAAACGAEHGLDTQGGHQLTSLIR